MTRTRVCGVLSTALCLSVAVGGQVAQASGPVSPDRSASPTAAAPAGATRVIVVAAGGDVAAAAATVRAAGGQVLSVQPAVGTVVASLPRGVVVSGPAVVGVSPDRSVRPQSLGSDASGQAGNMSLVADAIGARDLWKKGVTGKGIDVALIDTGVAPVPALSSSDKIVQGPDLSLESQVPALLHSDTYGHGTHMAGIIGGREGVEATGPDYAADTTNFYGIAPDSRIVSLKVADADGSVDVSQVIAAIDWVVQNRNVNGLNIRVINLSYGTPSTQDPLLDPLSYAVEAAVRDGIVVVTSGGNNGDTSGAGLIDPAYHPNALAVGAADTKGTASVTDDTVPSFSAKAGGSAAPSRAVDVVAPGVSLVSLRVPGSTVATANPAAAVGTWGLKGSGTSQAAAVVSGAVALLLQQRPSMQPPQVKYLLTATARKLTGVDATVQGSGEINLTAASTATYPLWMTQARGTGLGTLEGARGGVHMLDGTTPLTGETDLRGGTWNPVNMAGVTDGGSAWNGGQWNGKDWTGGAWADPSAAGAVWNGTAWTGRIWIGMAWAGNSWSGAPWSGRIWIYDSWTANGWQGSGWASAFDMNVLASKVWATRNWR